MATLPPFLHPLEYGGESLPDTFTFPFRYTPHPLCQRAAVIVQQKLEEMGVRGGKMYGVMVVRGQTPALEGERGGAPLLFLAAYSGQLNGSYNHPWFVPPVVDYLDPESHFQKEQAEIVGIGQRMEVLRADPAIGQMKERLATLRQERETAVAEAKRVYEEGKVRRATLERTAQQIRESQFQKANIHRAKHLYHEEMAAIEEQLRQHNALLHALYEERKQRSEALQQWLFEQFGFLNGYGEKKNLIEIFEGDERRHMIPSGAGECCAPKLLQAAYKLGLEPLAMAEFWWGPSSPSHYRQPGAFFPACHSKCRPILGHMLQGLNVDPDPAAHYDKVLAPVRIIWEDESIAVILKPEGWCSIPGRSDQANLFDEAHRIWPEIQGSIIVHRLDQDTSGLMLIAKNAAVHRVLSQQFARREVQKRYVALLDGRADGQPGGQRNGMIALPLGPDLEAMPHQRVDWESGKEAVTRFEVLGEEQWQGQPVTRVAFYPQTGRTHQLRVHASSAEGLNTPILGDRLYGRMADRLYLHAESITFVHPVTHEEMHFSVPTPF